MKIHFTESKIVINKVIGEIFKKISKKEKLKVLIQLKK